MESDALDLDFDKVSDLAEACFLGTNPAEPDTDQDGLLDGLDATPTVTDGVIPVNLEFAAIDMTAIPDKCDDGTTWDPFITGAAFRIPALEQASAGQFVGWTQSDLIYNRPNENPLPTWLQTSGTGSTTPAGALQFQLDPDLTTWSGGISDLQLAARWGGMAVDYDENWDDYMPFDITPKDILKLGGKTFSFPSQVASDGNGGSINCQTTVDIAVNYLGLVEQTLDVGKARLRHMNEVVRCSSPELNDCVVNGNWN